MNIANDVFIFERKKNIKLWTFQSVCIVLLHKLQNNSGSFNTSGYSFLCYMISLLNINLKIKCSLKRMLTGIYQFCNDKKCIHSYV